MVQPEISVSPVSEKSSSSTSERTERVETPAGASQMVIDISPLEQRLARLEYLLSNTLDVKIIN
jgi:hypothetical protein